MKNELMHDFLVKNYIKYSATKSEILCFPRGDMVWAVEVKDVSSLLRSITFIAKRSEGWGLKFLPNKVQQELILSNASRVEILCSVDYLEEIKKEHRNNRGDTVEFLVACRWGAEQNTSKSAKFTDCGDIRVNGIEYQVKYGARTGAATYTTEPIINRILERG